MALEVPQFLDLVHYYRISVTDPADHQRLNEILAGPRVTEDEKPPMMTEAAKKLPVPSWWGSGGTSLSQANLVAAKLKEH